MKIDFSRFYEIVNEKFWDFIDDKSRIRISYGGAGSSKSFTTFQEIIYKLLAEDGHNYLICRKVANTNKTSTYALFKQVASSMGVLHFFKENKSDMTFTVKTSGYMAVFKGLDDIEKIKSLTFPNGVLTDIIIEESSEIDQKDFDQLNVRLRGQKPKNIPFQITMLLNPINEQHWIKKEFFDLQSYQKRMSVFTIHSTYLDNEFIDDDYKSVLEGYKDIDYEFYKVYCLGQWGRFGNVIFNNWKVEECPYKESDFDAIYNGLDFGYVHPQVIVKIGFKDGVMYTYDELCITEKTNKEFILLNKEYDILHKGESIICDSANPDKIKEWVQHGYGALSAKKGKGSPLRGIDFIKSQKWIIDPKCVRTIQEVQIYHRKEDKSGNILEDPIEIFDDAIKAHMYALEPLSKLRGKPSVLSGSKSDNKKDLIKVKADERKKLKQALKERRKRLREEKKNKK